MNGKGQIVAIATVVGATAFSGGVALGHFLAQKKVQKAIDEELNRIWQQNRLEKKANMVPVTDESIVESGDSDLKDPRETPARRVITSGKLHSWGPAVDGPGEIISVTPVEEYGTGTGPVVTDIFDHTIPDWDYELELNDRSTKDIYVITHDEFYGDELHYKQDQLTYYKGDDILVDSLNKPIHRYDRFVGDQMKFGHGSKDPNVVFVRNETQRMELICDKSLLLRLETNLILVGHISVVPFLKCLWPFPVELRL